MTLTEQLIEDHGCPYFFNDKCTIEITNKIFNEYCLDNFKSCDTYKIIIEEEKMFVGSRK